MTQNPVANFYAAEGHLTGIIVDALRDLGKNINALKTDDLNVVDEFHIRGRKATVELAENMRLDADSTVLDIGSGLGGPARTVAEVYGCRVTGIDLTKAFCDTGNMLSKWVGIDDRVRLQ